MAHRFTCGESKVWWNIKKSQNIMQLIVDKTKTANLSKIKLITFTCTGLSSKKVYESTKEKRDGISNWSHLNLRRHNFDFRLCDTVVAVDLFVAAAVVVAAAAAAVVVPVVVAVGKNVQQ